MSSTSMKASIFSLIIVLVIMIVVPMIFLGDNELADQMGLKKPVESTFDGKTPTGVTNAVTDERVEIYTWVDKNGITQFSETPPKLGGQSERMVLEPNTNIMDPVKIPQQEPEELAGPGVINLGSTQSEGDNKDIGKQAAGLEKLLEQQKGEENSLLQQMLKQQ